MDESLIVAFTISIIYTIMCFINMRFIKKETIEFPVQIRNSVFVFISSIIGIKLIKTMGNKINLVDKNSNITAFTGNPGF